MAESRGSVAEPVASGAADAVRGIAGILLAAGSGSRFGSDKLLHRLADGVPMAVQAARRLQAAVGHCVAVVRPGADELTRLLRAEGLRVVVCADAAQGMGHSLAAAVASIRPSAPASASDSDSGSSLGSGSSPSSGQHPGLADDATSTSGFLVALADMPFIEPESYRAVCGALAHGASVAMPCWEGRRGHPVGFAAGHRAALEALEGDAGARHLIAALLGTDPSAATLVPVHDRGVVRDVDVLTDLE